MPKTKPAKSLYEQTRRKTIFATEDKILVRGPGKVIEDFRHFIKQNDFRNAWGALEHLMAVHKQHQSK